MPTGTGAAVNTDTMRLDFLIAHPEIGVMGNATTGRGYSVYDQSDGIVFLSRNCATARDAIDEAMTEHAVRIRRKQTEEKPE